MCLLSLASSQGHLLTSSSPYLAIKMTWLLFSVYCICSYWNLNIRYYTSPNWIQSTVVRIPTAMKNQAVVMASFATIHSIHHIKTWSSFSYLLLQADLPSAGKAHLSLKGCQMKPSDILPINALSCLFNGAVKELPYRNVVFGKNQTETTWPF